MQRLERLFTIALATCLLVLASSSTVGHATHPSDEGAAPGLADPAGVDPGVSMSPGPQEAGCLPVELLQEALLGSTMPKGPLAAPADLVPDPVPVPMEIDPCLLELDTSEIEKVVRRAEGKLQGLLRCEAWETDAGAVKVSSSCERGRSLLEVLLELVDDLVDEFSGEAATTGVEDLARTGVEELAPTGVEELAPTASVPSDGVPDPDHESLAGPLPSEARPGMGPSEGARSVATQQGMPSVEGSAPVGAAGSDTSASGPGASEAILPTPPGDAAPEDLAEPVDISDAPDPLDPLPGGPHENGLD